MKKYLSGIFAVLLAIGFSAFTGKKSQQQTTSLAPLYFWHYDPVNEELGDQVVYGAQTTFDVTDPDELAILVDLTCPDNGNVDCARGYTTSTKPTNELVKNNPAKAMTEQGD